MEGIQSYPRNYLTITYSMYNYDNQSFIYNNNLSKVSCFGKVVFLVFLAI